MQATESVLALATVEENAQTSVSGDLGIPEVYSRIDRAQTYLWCIVCLLLIPGNVLTICLVAKNRRMQTPSNILVAALAVADFGVGITGILIQILREHVNVCDAFYDTLLTVLLQVPILSAASHVFLIAVDRYIAIVYPLRYEAIVTIKLIRRMVVAVWLTILSLGLTIFTWPAKNRNTCFVDLPVAHWFGMNCILYLVTVVFLVFMYVRIFLIARKHVKHIQTISANSSSNRKKTRERNKTSKMLSYIVVTYLMAWSPAIMVTCISLFATPQSHNGQITLAILMVVCVIIGITNSGVNFFIYAWTSNTFRKGYVSLIMCRRRTPTAP